MSTLPSFVYLTGFFLLAISHQPPFFCYSPCHFTNQRPEPVLFPTQFKCGQIHVVCHSVSLTIHPHYSTFILLIQPLHHLCHSLPILLIERVLQLHLLPLPLRSTIPTHKSIHIIRIKRFCCHPSHPSSL